MIKLEYFVAKPAAIKAYIRGPFVQKARKETAASAAAEAITAVALSFW